MAALTIDHLALRYRIPVAQRDRERELERVREQVFGHALEAALEAAGVGVHELVAVRELSVPVRVSASLSMAAIVEQWTNALSEAIATRVRLGDPREVVRYRSITAALVDLGRCVARSDLRRSWVWATLGLVEAAAVDDLVELREGFVTALQREPRASVAVLAELARTPPLLSRLALSLPSGVWRGWAVGALGVHAVPRELVERLWAAASEGGSSAVARRDLRPGAASVARPTGREQSHALFKLLGRSTLLAALEPELFALMGSVSRPDSRAPTEIAAAILRAAQRDRSVLARLVIAILAESPAAAMHRMRELAELLERVALTRTRADDSRAQNRRAHTDEREPDPATAQLDPRPTIEPWSDIEPTAELATTRWGGLLLLFALFPALDLWTELSELSERLELDLRALMRRFGQLLSAERVAADDPGLLAFAGLPPDAELEPLEASAELDEPLHQARARVVELLDERLGPLQTRRGEGLLGWVLERRAEILADPGWIELRFDLRDVDAAIRRVGLDLDPDWLPTLGVVVKFTYA